MSAFNIGDDEPDTPAASADEPWDDPTEGGHFKAVPDDDGDDGIGSEGIDLDFGGVDSIVGFVPVPSGGYVLEFTDAKIVPTNDKLGHNVEVRIKIGDGALAGRSIGIDRWYVPNKKSQDPKKYKATAGFFKGRLEAVYGREIEDNFRLNVRELPGMRCKAIVMLVDEGYGPQNKVTAYLSMSTDLSNIVLPTPSAPREKRGNGGGNAEGDAKPGRFTI